MKLLKSKTDELKVIMIALDDNDVEVLEFFFKNTWGFYALWIRDTEFDPKRPDDDSDIGKVYLALESKGIKPRAIGALSTPKDYVEEEKTITKKEVEQVNYFKEL